VLLWPLSRSEALLRHRALHARAAETQRCPALRTTKVYPAAKRIV